MKIIKESLFLNVEPDVISDPNFYEGFTKKYLHERHIHPDQIVLEITERSALYNYNNYSKILNHYKNQGYRLAIDDMGAGYSNLSSISKIKPFYIKIDMDLIKDIDKDPFNQAIIQAFVSLSNLTNTRLIAEGVETKEELEVLIKYGVHAAQGYYIAKPDKTLSAIPDTVVSHILYLNNYIYIP